TGRVVGTRRGDEDFRTRLEIALVPRHVNNNGRIGGDKDLLFSVLVFQRQRLSINRGVQRSRWSLCSAAEDPTDGVFLRFRGLRCVLPVRSGCRQPAASP